MSNTSISSFCSTVFRFGPFLCFALLAARPARAANHVVEPATDGRMLNLRTVYPAVGDTVTLPTADEGCEYVIGNPTIAKMIDANTMEILRTGATSVAYYKNGSPSSAWNDCADVVVPPTPKAGGKVYVWTRTANDGSGNWDDNANWYCVTTETAGGAYPNAIDDVAMVFLNGQRKWLQVAVRQNVTVGSLWIGQVRHQYSSGDFVERWIGPGTVTLASSEGPAELHLLGSSTDNKTHAHVFGYSSDTSKRLKINMASSVEADLGFRYGDVESSSVEFLKFNYVDLTIPEGNTFTIRNIHNGNRGAALHSFEFTSNCKVAGAGTVINDSAATVGRWGDWSAFTGTYIEQGSDHQGYNDNNNNGNLYLTQPSNPDSKLVVRGFPQLATTSGGSTFHGNLTSWGNFAGFARFDGTATANPGNRANFAEIKLQGGFLDFRVDLKSGWTDPKLVYAPKKLVAAEGFSGIVVQQTTKDPAYPTNILDIADISNAKGAMLSIREPMSTNQKNSTDDVRGYVRVGNFADHAIGGEGDVVASDRNYKIIPWLISPRKYDGGYSQFYGINEDGVLVTAASRKSDRLMNVADEDNAALEGEYCHLSDTQRSKVNSLFLREVTSAKHYIGKGRRLEVTSGGIILSRNGIIGNVGDDGVSEGTNAGEIYLPNRGYIWEINPDGENLDGQIWDKLVAPQGISFAGVNKYSPRIILGGDQRGIEKDIAINAGTLQLGNDTVGCQLGDVEVRIVGATSTLKVMPASARGLKNTKIVLRDVAGYPAKLQLPEGETVVLRNLVVEDDNGVQKPLRPGVYAAEAGEGVDYVDPHLVGTGKLNVPTRALVIFVR